MSWTVTTLRAFRRYQVPTHVGAVVQIRTPVQPPAGWSIVVPNLMAFRKRYVPPDPVRRIDPPIAAVVQPPAGWSIVSPNHWAFRCRQVPIHTGVVKGFVSAPPPVVQPLSGWSVIHASVRAACRGLVGGLIGCSEFAAGAAPLPVNLDWLFHPLSLYSVRRSHTPYHVGVTRLG